VIRISDLGQKNLKQKLLKVREQKFYEINSLSQNDFLVTDLDEFQQELTSFMDDSYLDWIVNQFTFLSKSINVVDDNYFRNKILNREGCIVVESSHGVLTDSLFGFYPHNSRIRTLPELTSWNLLNEFSYDGEVVKLGVTRAYQIKHGAGPFVVDDESMAKTLLPGELEKPDRYRGKIKVGPLDLVMLKYAINVCKGPESFDGICLTWFDSIMKLGKWKICKGYTGNNDSEFFSSDGGIRVFHSETEAEQINYQAKLTEKLYGCSPIIFEHSVSATIKKNEVIDLCQTLDSELGVPVRMIGLGPSETEKVLI
jgi:adenylosuccinate synthase